METMKNELQEKKIFKLRNQIRNYAWGSKTYISHLQGKDEISEEPQAELWMGTHPQSPSRIMINGKEESLLKVISEDPRKMLGEKTAGNFNNELPFLFKILAAASPLSIQAHPNKKQAERGFNLENIQGISLHSSERNYIDNNHKPELICALTSFEAMCGFQPIKDIVERIKYLKLEDQIPGIIELDINSSAANLKKIFSTLLRTPEEIQTKCIGVLINRITKLEPRNENDKLIFKWISKLAAIYPKDMGVFLPLFLNVIKLKLGEGLFIDAGILHSYLNGCGVEIMANSDNVLRGGLTSKKVDIPELIKTLKFEESGLKKIKPKIVNNEYIYHTSAREFQLSKLIIKDDEPFVKSNLFSAEIILCTMGSGEIKWLDSVMELKQGESVFIPFSISEYSINGDLHLFRVLVPSGETG